MSRTEYPQLLQLFGCYFHQDWDLEGDDWCDVVRSFARESTADLSAAADEIERLLTQCPDERGVKDVVFVEMHCYYDPRPDLGGPSIREWLQQMAVFMRSEVHAK